MIMMVMGLISFLVGLTLVGTVYNRIAPCWLFGEKLAQEQQIRVVENGRNYLRFSNDPSAIVPKSKLGQLNVMTGIARFIVIICILYGLVFITVQVVRRWDAQLANEVWLLARGKQSEH